MAQGGPIAMKELLSLPNVGVNPQFITFTNCTMESEKYICIRETGAQNQVVIVDMANPSTPIRRPITADSAIMNPQQKIIALKATVQGGSGDNLQIFNLDTKQKIKAHVIPESLVFWKWITNDKLGLVTGTAVYHWDMTNESAQPVKLFVRTPNLNGTQIINYRVDAAEKWCVLIGIAAGAPERPQLVKGFMQLYSVEQQRSQALEAHAAAFSQIQVPGAAAASSCIAFAMKTVKDGSITSKLHVIQLGAQQGAAPMKRQAELFFPNEFADDFPVAMQVSDKYGLIYVVTKAGLLFVYDLETATAIYRNRVSQESVFLTSSSESTGGVITINRRGQVQLLTPNDQTMVSFVSGQLQNVSLALAMAKRGNMPGAEQLVVQEFEQMMQGNQFKEAAECAADSPQGVLRTREVMERLKAVPPQPGQKAPLLVYFGNLLARGALNPLESVELARLVLSQNKKDLLLNWMREGKLAASEELGDLLQQAGEADLALQAFQQSGSSQKAVMAMAAKGDIESLVQYAGGSGVKPDYMYLLQSLMMNNPQGAVELAKKIVKEPGPPIEINTMADLFLQRNMIREATAFLLDALQDDKPEYGPLQTKLIEVNLISNPQVADAILGNNSMTHYDRPRIAQLCEKGGLYMRALQHYTDLPDIKRCIVNTHAIDPQALTEYFGSLSADWALACMKEMLITGMQQNLQLVVQIAKEYTEQLGADAVIEMFESFDSYVGLFYYLGAYIAFSEDPEVHFKYIQAAAKTGNVKEVERHTRESNHYPAEKVKNFLMDTKLPDARPLINVCDRFDMVADLTNYLYGNNMLRFIEGYVQRVNPANTPTVVGALLDLEAPDEFINNLILSVRALVPVGPLVEEVEKRNRLKLLTPFLEHLVSEGNQDVHVHNALGKIIIDTNNNPEHFLTTNPYYDSLVVGAYCEKRDPNLACVAYKRGLCDDALVACTNKHSLFKLQARYITERMEPDLWAKVLDDNNEFRRQLIDQVVSTALPESKNPEQVSTTVKAFMQANLQSELIELLEKIVLNNSSFASNSNLQNLLIITAIKTDRSRVKDYIYRLDKFDGPAVGEIAVGYEMYEEAFEIYKKFGHKVLAMKVLMDHMEDYDRAHEYATKVDEPEVWSELGHMQLSKSMVKEAIESYLRANDHTRHAEVIDKTAEVGCYPELVKYLLMVRRKVKDVKVDSELVYAFAKTDDLGALEEFISGTHQANLQQSGDRCFNEEMFEAARILFQAIPNWGRLASTLVRLRKFQEAVDAARKANSPRVWKEVCFACVDEKEFRLAQLCGLNIIINADDLEEVSMYYQERGHFDQIIELLQSGIGLERAHMGIFTELGILYAKFQPQLLMEHLKLFVGKINIPRLIRVCEEQMHWKELTFLYVAYDEYDNAAAVMMQHSADAWEHIYFKDVAVKVSSADVYYKGVSFYLDEHPDLLNDLLRVLEARMDHSRVVDIIRRADQLPLIKEYLTSVQKNNLVAVNEAMNELLIEEEDFDGLRSSITTYDNFDQLGLAYKLESHGLLEFRRISALLYKNNLKWEKAIELAKADKLYKDAMETCAQSGKTELVEDLLRFFVENKEKECFAACLYTCFDHIKADVALELAWVNGLMDYTMPFLITFVKDTVSKVELLIQERQDALDRAEEESKKQSADEAARNAYITLAPLALPAPAMPGQDGGQFGGGGGFGGNQYGGAPGFDMGGGFGGQPQPGMGFQQSTF